MLSKDNSAGLSERKEEDVDSGRRGRTIVTNIQEQTSKAQIGQLNTSVNQRRLYNDYPTCSKRHGRLEHSGKSLNQRRLYNNYPTCSKRHGRLEHVG